jgi:hypothetical protein
MGASSLEVSEVLEVGCRELSWEETQGDDR